MSPPLISGEGMEEEYISAGKIKNSCRLPLKNFNFAPIKTV
jgi:hypothetical protein